MKKITLCALIICAAITVQAQKGTMKYKPTACAENLMESYRRLAARSGLKSCFTDVYSVTGYMQAGCYSNQKDSGHVTFASYLHEISGKGSVFHTTWDSARLGYDYYGVCYPAVMVWDVPWTVSTRNHVYEAYLINTTDYQKSLTRTYDGLKKYAVKSDKIEQIVSWSYENSSGWIATKEPSSYNNIYSSKGLSVTVKLKDKTTITCYLMNNYDGALTLVWKSPMSLSSFSLTEQETVHEENIKLISASMQQNQPNPANNNTVISYMLPDKFSSAKIKITDYTGNSLKEINLKGTGNGKINADVHNLNNGTYKYSLIIDGVITDTKTMVVAK